MDAPNDLRITRVMDLAAPLAVRAEVFIDEQGVTEMQDVDGDDPLCQHWLARDAAGPVATLRARRRGDVAKIQRVAVLRRARGTGCCAALMRRAMADLTQEGVREFVLGSQIGAIGFYERLGFTVRGPVYDDAGIAHRDMTRTA